MPDKSINLFRFFNSLCLPLLLTATLSATGCVSKSAARQQARNAYLAGQRDAMMRLEQESHGPNVTVMGPVNKHVIPWTDGLTLAQIVVKAGYNGATDPRNIVIERGGQNFQFNPQNLLKGQDFPLQPGDIVVFQP